MAENSLFPGRLRRQGTELWKKQWKMRTCRNRIKDIISFMEDFVIRRKCIAGKEEKVELPVASLLL